MRSDPIIEEVRKVREQYARKFGYDVDRIFADLKKSEQKRLGNGRGKGKGTAKAVATKAKAVSPKRRKAA